MKENRVSKNTQHEFTKVKSNLISLTVLSDELIEHMDEGRTGDDNCFGFC